MRTLIKKILPDEVELRVRRQKKILTEKWNRNHLDSLEKRKIRLFSGTEYNPVLFGGFPKSGNTWLRFLIYNYYNIKINDASDTITYSELNEVYQPDVIGIKLKGRLGDKVENNKINGIRDGFPLIIRTHEPFKRAYKIFNKTIFISRNPLDTLTSKYFFHVQNRNQLKEPKFPFNNIDSYVRFYYPFWEYHLKTYLSVENKIHVTYEGLKKVPAEHLERVLFYLGENELDKNAIEKSVAFSSFNSIKKMGRKTGQTHGMAPKESYNGEFTRKGEVGGYKDELASKTIKKIKDKLYRADLNYYGDL